MKFFTCTRVDYPPYLKFDCCARDVQELLERGLGSYDDGVLTLVENVYSEDNIPPIENGIYPVDFEKGAFVPRCQQQLDAARMAQQKADRQRYVGACDREVATNIGQGFDFDGHRFSLSANAQLNWLRVGVNLSLGLLKDVSLPTLDNDIYLLKSSKASLFLQAYSDRVEKCLLNNAKFNE
jgi:hypothetical protein